MADWHEFWTTPFGYISKDESVQFELLKQDANQLPILSTKVSRGRFILRVGFGYSALALISTNKGLGKITPNQKTIQNELDDNWEVLTEAVQTLMRLEGVPDAYEQLKDLSRGTKLTKETYKNFITGLKISDKSKSKLLSLSPSSYIGIAEKL